ncbi:TlpA family protein disulfide reductase [Nocardia iowensis]|uniref:Redoxin domain-containing protein n=1 Tax=Nocardia iowensis TaxID=204891 RepID=A0ABX8RGD5_NOCIO|nr:redoxin domain-containing protein [Nocardia iowensis]QXN88401.1 redoxin domain-containing protein [Nocardia iowensis]
MKIGQGVLLLAAALLVTGCVGSGEDTNPAVASSARSAAQISSSAGPGAPVPEPLRFTARTVDGAEFFGASLVGKPVVLWFWAPGCPDCRTEAPRVAEAARTHPDVQFVGVAAGDQIPAMRAFAADHALPFASIADTDGSVSQRFRVTDHPAFVFVSKYTEVDTVPGTLSEPELTARIASLD